MAENDEQDLETYEEDSPRSIFSALWFRALVVVLVLGVVAAVAVPYVLDVMTTQTARPTVAIRPTASPPPTAAPPQPAPTAQAAPPAATAPGPVPAAEPPKPEATKPDASKPEPPKPEAAKPEPAKPQMPKPEPAHPLPVKPEGPRAVATKPGGPAKPGEALVAVEPAQPGPAARAPAAAASTGGSKPAGPPRVAAAPPAPRESLSPRPVVRSASGAAYWVQVGAFKNATRARRLADKLREQNFTVEQSVRTRRVTSAKASGPVLGAADRYNVFVSGLAPTELTAKLGAKGHTAQPVAGGVMVTPTMPLREAVMLSKDLASEGLKVQVRRVATPGGAGSGPSPSASPSGVDQVIHRVRVGAFADRAAAVAAAKALEAKGFKVYIARGNQ